MILRHLSITASSDASPQTSKLYGWSEGNPVEHLESAIAQLQEFAADLRKINPLKAARPIVTDSEDFTLQTPK